MNDIVLNARAAGELRMGQLDILEKGTDVVDLRRRIGIVFQSRIRSQNRLRHTSRWDLVFTSE